jgi:hypothetical protein
VVDVFEPIPVSDVLLRQAVFMAFGGRCFYTGRAVPFAEMHIDHIRPRSKGGQDCIANYVLCCQEINLKKLDRHADSFEEVVTETVKLLFADRIATVLDDLRMNQIEGFSRPNDFLRKNKVPPNSGMGLCIKSALRSRKIPSIKRGRDDKSTRVILYRDADLQRLLDEYTAKTSATASERKSPRSANRQAATSG